MSAPATYVLDANVFMEAHRRYYHMEICPGFWEVLAEHGPERLISIDKVKDEILAGDDLLKDWVKATIVETHFAATDDLAVLGHYRDLMRSVQANPHYLDRAKAEFATVADGWIAAYAKANGAKVVTHEEFDANIKKRVKLPNICRELGVETIDTFALLRDLEAKFVWLREAEA
ncbi:MAG: hypothetical protein ACI9ZV_000452 [Candidatus Azotimanducaceae bacterium]|jgi:hypothetical protein